jgi:D-alanyl-D-alanine carboxypeptidase
MNEYAKSLNCTGTQFTNPHGLHNADQYITARDAARILDAAIHNESFRSIFTTDSYTVPATNVSEERKLGTNNSMKDSGSKLYYDPRVIGGRTGVAGDGRRCIATAAESNGMLLITVVMGSETEYQEDGYSAIRVGGYHETTALLDAGFSGYKSAQVLSADQILTQCEVLNGDCDVILGSHISVSAVLPEAVTAEALSFRYAENQFQAPIEKGQAVSSVEVWYQNMCVAEAELFAMNSVELNDPLQQTVDRTEKDGGSIQWTFLVIASVAIVVCFTLFLRKNFKRLISKVKSKQYKRSRRRSR